MNIAERIEYLLWKYETRQTFLDDFIDCDPYQQPLCV